MYNKKYDNLKKLNYDKKYKSYVKDIEESQNVTSDNIVITTSKEIPNREVVGVIDVINAETVIPNGIFGAITTGTFFTFEALDKAREMSFEKVKDLAYQRKADAIISVDVDISDLNGNGILVSVNGTAVKTVVKDEVIDFVDEYENIVEKNKQIELDNLSKKELFIKGIDRKENLYEALCEVGGEFSLIDVRDMFDNKVDVMEIGAYLQAMINENKLRKNEETKKYSVTMV